MVGSVDKQPRVVDLVVHAVVEVDVAAEIHAEPRGSSQDMMDDSLCISWTPLLNHFFSCVDRPRCSGGCVRDARSVRYAANVKHAWCHTGCVNLRLYPLKSASLSPRQSGGGRCGLARPD